jgi:hypothetical protein
VVGLAQLVTHSLLSLCKGEEEVHIETHSQPVCLITISAG